MRQLIARARPRLRRLSLNLLVLAASSVVAMLLGEVVVRVIAPQQLIQIRPDLWMPADTLGWVHRPNVSTSINTGERTVRVFTDENGFRVGAPRSEGPTEGDLLILGDSFMEALQVEYQQSTAGLLQAELPALTGRDLTVHNASIDGWDPDQYLLRARSLLPRESYEVVLTAVYLGNDVIDYRRERVPPRRPVRRHTIQLPDSFSWAGFRDAVLRPINDFLEVRSHLFLFFKNRLQTLRMEAGLAVLAFPPQFLVSEAESSRWDNTADLLEAIDQVAEQHGAVALFALIPAPFQVDSTDLNRYLRGYDLDPEAIDIDLPNRRLAEELSERGLSFQDALPEFRAAHDSGTELYGRVDQHLTPEGNALFAELIAPAVAEAFSR